jgi:hypothetical protein
MASGETGSSCPHTHCSFTTWPSCRHVYWLTCRPAGDPNPGAPMYRVAFVASALLILTLQAQARPHTYLHQIQHFRQAMAMAPGDEKIVSARPSGCPNAFCGCEASLYKFGRIIPELNLAGNWRRFPRAAPAPGMAAVTSGHVMILEQHVAGDVWYVHDGNSGGHVTREHPRSIAGYAIVDPSAGSSAGSSPSLGAPSGSTTVAQTSSFARPTQAASFTRPGRTSRFTRLAQGSPSTNNQTPLFAN